MLIATPYLNLSNWLRALECSYSTFGSAFPPFFYRDVLVQYLRQSCGPNPVLFIVYFIFITWTKHAPNLLRVLRLKISSGSHEVE